MENETKKLAKEFLIMRIQAHINSKATGLPQKPVVEQWYSDCLALATAIAEVTA